MSLPTNTLRRAIALTIMAASMSPLTAMAAHSSGNRSQAATKHSAPVHHAPIQHAIQHSASGSKSPIQSNKAQSNKGLSVHHSKNGLPTNTGFAGGLQKTSISGQKGQQGSQSPFAKFSKPVTSAANSTATSSTSNSTNHLSNAHSLSFGDILSAPAKAAGSVISDAGSVVKTVGDGAAKAATGAVSTVGNAVGSVFSGGSGQKASTPATGTGATGAPKTSTTTGPISFGGFSNTGGTGATGSVNGTPKKTTTPTPATTGTAATGTATPATTTTAPATTTATPAATTATPAATTAGGGNGGGFSGGGFVGGGGLASVLANLPIGGGFGGGSGGGGYAAPASYAPAPMDYSQQASYQQPVNQGGSVDLVLEDAKVVSPATRFAGPAVAITYRNSGSMASPRFMVSVVTSEDGQYRADAPRATVEVPGLGAGQSSSVVLRMPRGESKFVILSLDANSSVNDLNKDNNSAVVELSSL